MRAQKQAPRRARKLFATHLIQKHSTSFKQATWFHCQRRPMVAKACRFQSEQFAKVTFVQSYRFPNAT